MVNHVELYAANRRQNKIDGKRKREHEANVDTGPPNAAAEPNAGTKFDTLLQGSPNGHKRRRLQNVQQKQRNGQQPQQQQQRPQQKQQQYEEQQPQQKQHTQKQQQRRNDLNSGDDIEEIVGDRDGEDAGINCHGDTHITSSDDDHHQPELRSRTEIMKVTKYNSQLLYACVIAGTIASMDNNELVLKHTSSLLDE